jgi:hypothetical protein
MLKIFNSKQTKIFLIVTALAVIIWDIFAHPTESSIIRHWGNVSMAFPFSITMLVAHWFLPWGLLPSEKGDPPDAIWWKTTINFVFLLTLIYFDIRNNLYPFDVGYIGVPITWVWLIIGVLFGHYFWGQGKEKK